jgi:hypothetical protein
MAERPGDIVGIKHMSVRECPHEIGAQNSGFGGGMEAEQVESRLQRRNVELEMPAPMLRLPEKHGGQLTWVFKVGLGDLDFMKDARKVVSGTWKSDAFKMYLRTMPALARIQRDTIHNSRINSFEATIVPTVTDENDDMVW